VHVGTSSKCHLLNKINKCSFSPRPCSGPARLPAQSLLRRNPCSHALTGQRPGALQLLNVTAAACCLGRAWLHMNPCSASNLLLSHKVLHSTSSPHHRNLNSESVLKDPDECMSSTNAVSVRFISAAISCLSESVSGRCSGLSKHVAAAFPRKALVVKASTCMHQLRVSLCELPLPACPG
jgi:hypothetical protein